MRILAKLFSFLCLCAISGIILIFMVFQYYTKDLPDYSYLKDYQPPILTRLYADDGRMLATIAAERRVFVPINTIPPLVSGAFLAAEDQHFYSHPGIDFFGVMRAVLINIKNIGKGRRPVGASTITQQVAKNMLLTNEVSLARKVKEVILAGRIEQSLSKNRILEIYLNEIFLGKRSYGVAQAAMNYFNKSLDELTIAEAAYLAALPKAPNNYRPERHYKAAVTRRNWVLSRMVVTKLITQFEADVAVKLPLETFSREKTRVVEGGSYFAEEVRRQLVSQFGKDSVLEGGLTVKTSLDPKLQKAATDSLRAGLIAYDMRNRGWRGPVAHLKNLEDWQESLAKIAQPAGSGKWRLALVAKNKPRETQIVFADATKGAIPWPHMRWARKELGGDRFGPEVHKPSDVLKIGDVVLVETVELKEGEEAPALPAYKLRQIPKVQGAIVALDPHTGRVYAMTGGFSSQISQYNRATQAFRQPGSAFKPFVYMAALNKGFTPSSLILDAPFEYDQGPGLPIWKPENYSQLFYGPTPLRRGIEKSRNVMTVRLANSIGMEAVVEEAKKFGVVDDMPTLLSFSLGAKETTPMRLATAYGMIVNGGKKIHPSLIDRVQDRNGRTVWRTDTRPCEGCETDLWIQGSDTPYIPDTREQVEDPRIAYQMVSMMEGVVKRGTGIRLRSLGIPLAGKTGTTNESRDAWFIGYTPDLVAAVYVGFDEPKPLGKKESGSSVAVPIFKSFITKAMKDKPIIPFRVPPGLRMVRIDAETGAVAPFSDKKAMWEAYIPETEPKEGERRIVLDGTITGEASMGVEAMTPVVIGGENGDEGTSLTPSTQGTGGLY